MSQEVMQSWEQRASDREAQEMEAKGEVVRQVKKRHWTCPFGEITVEEQTYLTKARGKLRRPFQSAAAISCRAYTLRLQRVITDFGVALSRLPE